MRYMVTQQRIDVLGYIWQPGTGLCAYTRNLDAHELAQITNPRDRAQVAAWVDTHFGDFQQVTDFRADFHVPYGHGAAMHVVHEWQQEESEAMFFACTEGDA